jgi:hypothetical protein
LALLNLAIDSKLRAGEEVRLKVEDAATHDMTPIASRSARGKPDIRSTGIERAVITP